MGDGLTHAALEALLTRGPWAIGPGKHGPGLIRDLQPSEVRALYDAIPAPSSDLALVLGVAGLSDRKADRAFQLLKRAGLIVFDKTERAWRKP